MHWLLGADWRHLWYPTTPLLEIFLRGTVMYLGLFLMLRFILKREYSGMGISDLLVIVLIADASQNGMADDYRAVTDGLLLVLVILGWAYAIDRLTYRFPRLERIVKPNPLPLVKDGSMLRANMRKELVTVEELQARLREQGVDDVAQVKLAVMESDGTLSVIAGDGGASPPTGAPRPT